MMLTHFIKTVPALLLLLLLTKLCWGANQTPTQVHYKKIDNYRKYIHL